MGFKRVPQKFTASINEVTIGTGDKAIKIGGENVRPMYTFDAEIANRPKIGVEISDAGYDKTVATLAEYYAGAETLADIAKKAVEMPGADFLAINLEGADPNGENKSVEDCVAAVKEIAGAVDVPMAIIGCKNAEKNAELFTKIADLLQGKNVLFISAKEENYKTIAAGTVMGSGKLCLETGVHPAVLKDQVCSPGGTTIAGVMALEENGLRNAVIKSVTAAAEKTAQMAANK